MPEPTRKPIRRASELGRASADRVRRHIQYELRQLLAAHDLTQEDLTQPLDVANQSTIAKWISSRDRVLPIQTARRLDAGFMLDGVKIDHAPSIGVSWEGLVRAHKAAKTRAPARTSEQGELYDVFLASPMASTLGSEAYLQERRAALDLKSALEIHCGMSVYYAGTNVHADREFDAPDIAAESNFQALLNSRFFILLVTQALTRPSSVWVEAGWALATQTPSLYLFPEPDVLPYCLRHLNQHTAHGLMPPVAFYHPTNHDTATDFIRNQGVSVLGRLEEAVDRRG